jgi:transcriptional regulator with XRE-family HTH domain
MPTQEPADPALADTIRKLREERDWSQEIVAFEAQISVGSYARIERGASNPAWTTVVRIARGLGVSVADLAIKAGR